MKKSLLTLLAVLVFYNFSYAGTLLYEPQEVNLRVAAGSIASFPLTVTMTDPQNSRNYYLLFVRSVTGEIPAGWVSSSVPYTFVSSRNPGASTIINLNVPFGTPPGVYKGRIYSIAMLAHGITQGAGVHVTLEVPPQCSEAPKMEITGFGPEIIWPPDHKLDHVTVTGIVTMQEGCHVIDMGYSIIDEYDELTGEGVLIIDQNGAFEVSIPVEASRKGNDKDGRNYAITLFVENEAGLSKTDTLNAFVPHDMRDK